jgi:hypothetical protein
MPVLSLAGVVILQAVNNKITCKDRAEKKIVRKERKERKERK